MQAWRLFQKAVIDAREGPSESLITHFCNAYSAMNDDGRRGAGPEARVPRRSTSRSDAQEYIRIRLRETGDDGGSTMT